MKYLAFTIIFLASCGRVSTKLKRYEVKEKGHTYIIYAEYKKGMVVIDATKDSLTVQLLKQTLNKVKQ